MRRPVMIGALAALVIALVGSMALALGTISDRSSGPTMMRGYGQSSGPNMMGDQSWEPNMMGGSNSGPNMMGDQSWEPSRMGGSMMGSAGGMGMVWLPGDGTVVSSIPAARARAATGAKAAGLHPGEVMWFDNGFYVELKDAAGKPATEILVDPRTGAVTTEPGPAMMWNTRFGMHGGSQAATSVAAAIDAKKASTIATSWLADNQAGTTIDGIDAYPGYFTLDLKRNGSVSGMMSVNSATGAVWYHTWHGAFIAMEDS